MPSVRSLILLAVFVFAVSLLLACLSLLRPPDSSGMGQDTYGITRSGFRAIYEVLDELNIPVQREFHPPQPDSPANTMVLLRPHPALSGTEPKYLRSLTSWVEKGGTLIVAQGVPTMMERNTEQLKDSGLNLPSVWESLDLTDVTVQASSRFAADEVGDMSLEDFLVELGEQTAPAVTVNTTVQGSFLDSLSSVQKLAVHGDEFASIQWRTTEPTGTLTIEQDGETRVLAAEFARGQGRIVAVANSSLFANRLLPMADNSILAVRLFSPDGAPVVFDEFYHGLSVRGNSLYLLTRPGYAALALGLLAIAILTSWREAVLLGPSLEDEPHQRRDIGEYVAAMGQFFAYGKRSRPFLLERVRDGVIRQLNMELSLPTDNRDEELIITTLARKNPQRAEQVKKSLEYVHAKLMSQKSWTESETTEAMRRMTTCL